MKQILKSADEYDIVSRYWRHMYCYTQRAGVTSKIKQRMRRRIRREGKVEAREPW